MRGVRGGIELGQAFPRPAGHHQGGAERCPHVGFAFSAVGTACGSDRGPKLLQGGRQLPEVTEHDAGGLVGIAGTCLIGVRPKELASPSQRHLGGRQGERQQGSRTVR